MRLASPSYRIDRHRFFFSGLILCYSLIILACLTVRPLWLDEVLQLIRTTSPSLGDMIRAVPFNPGAVPLGYLTQRPFVLFGGPSTFWARLPAVIFSVLSGIIFIRLCRELKIPRGTTALAAILFLIVPSQIRYSTEGRPYSEALCFCLLSMLAFVKLAQKPSVPMACLAIAATVAGLYTQPYTIFAVCGVSAWKILSDLRRGESRRVFLPIACLVISVALFLPCYLLYSQDWNTSIQVSGYPKFHWTLTLAQDFVKGISGGSFLCSAALVVLAIAGLSEITEITGLLLLSVLFVLVGALAGDAIRNYFFASRQILFALPGLSILAALGFERMFAKSRTAAIVCLGVFVIASLKNDVTMQIDAKEDWLTAAKTLAKISKDGYCIQLAGHEDGILTLYSVFIPDLNSRACASPPTQSPSKFKVAFVTNLAVDTAKLEAAKAELRDLGFSPQETISVGGTTITMGEIHRSGGTH